MNAGQERPLELALSIDDYGRYARASYFADYLEYRAVLGDRVPMSQLVDMILQNDWSRRDLSLATIPEYEEDFDEAVDFDDVEDSIAARIGDVLRHRQSSLEEHYPFSIEGSNQSTVLSLKENAAQTGPYMALLALTLAHSNGLRVDGLNARSVEDAFEDLVSLQLGESGLPCIVIPTDGKYENKIRDAVAPLGISPDVNAAARSRRAKDGGTDLVCNPPGPDPRSLAGFLILGQATCGTTETWPSKAKEPDVAAWRRMLQMDWNPMRFLAVPHHVDRQYWRLLSQESECVVLDRIRLVAMSQRVTTDLERVTEAVFGSASRAC